MFKKTFSPQIFTLNLFVLLVLIVVALHPTGLAKAATFSVSTQAQLSAAITTANGNAETDTIILLNDIALTSALPIINSANNLTIEGNGYRLYRSGATAFTILRVVGPGNLTLNNLTIQNGSTGSVGGGIWNRYSGSVLILNNCTLIGNQGNRGGGLLNEGTATINNTTFTGNTATAAEGGAIRNLGTMTINNSTLSGNTATTLGGGIQHNAGSLTINNSTITGNSAAANGGGGIQANANMTINRSIISNNTAATAGAEIATNGTAVVTSANNVWGHSGLTNTTAFLSFTPSGSDYNATSSGFNIPITSILNALMSNGGATQTHSIPAGSPALDRSANANCTAAPINGLDQRGIARNFDSDGTAGNDCDSGAYEARALTWGSCTSGSISGSHDFLLPQATVSVLINSATNLSCISVEEVPAPHPNGTTGIQLSNRWWRISNNPSASFNVDLTLPASFIPDSGDLVCRYNGTWDCGANSMDGDSITRSGVTQFSDWAIDEDQAPTAVTVSAFDARAALPWVLGLLAACILGVVSLWAVWQIKKQA